jgi:hypothetical protein
VPPRFGVSAAPAGNVAISIAPSAAAQTLPVTTIMSSFLSYPVKTGRLT